MKNLSEFVLEAKKKDTKVNIKKWSNGYESEALSGHKVIKWPESQLVIKKKGAEDNAWLIDDEEGFGEYGSAAFVVNQGWWEGKDDSEDEEEKEEKSEDETEKDEDEE